MTNSNFNNNDIKNVCFPNYNNIINKFDNVQETLKKQDILNSPLKGLFTSKSLDEKKLEIYKKEKNKVN